MFRSKIIIGIVVSLFVVSAMATTIHMPDDYPTIQAGIDASEDMDTVLVAEGIYFENINFSGKDIVVESENGPQSTVMEILYLGTVTLTYGMNINTVNNIIAFNDKWGIYN